MTSQHRESLYSRYSLAQAERHLLLRDFALGPDA